MISDAPIRFDFSFTLILTHPTSQHFKAYEYSHSDYKILILVIYPFNQSTKNDLAFMHPINIKLISYYIFTHFELLKK